MGNYQSIGRPAVPDDIADIALWLASDQSAMATIWWLTATSPRDGRSRYPVPEETGYSGALASRIVG
jgi:hypothetical protein